MCESCTRYHSSEKKLVLGTHSAWHVYILDAWIVGARVGNAW